MSDRYAPIIFTKGDTLGERVRLWVISRLRSLLLAIQEPSNLFSLCMLGFIPAGLLAFLVYAKIKTNDLLATFPSRQGTRG